MKLTTTGPFEPSAPNAEVCTFTSCTMSGLGTEIEVQSQPSSRMFVPSIRSAVPPRYGTPAADTPLPTEEPAAPTPEKSMLLFEPLDAPLPTVITPGSV